MFKGGAVVADKDSDGLVILLDESEGCIGFEGGGATDGDGGSRFHGMRFSLRLSVQLE